MVNRAPLLNHLVLLGLFVGFLSLPRIVSEAHSGDVIPGQNGTESPSQDTGAEPLTKALKSLPGKAPDAWDVVLRKLALAGVLGLTLALVYRASYTSKEKKYRPSMMQTQLLLCVGGALVWIIVANNIVRAFGLGGALAFIRYRTPLRDPKDTMVVFLSMLVGMACGLDLYQVALIATGFISLVLLAMYQFRLGEKKKSEAEPEELSSTTRDQD